MLIGFVNKKYTHTYIHIQYTDNDINIYRKVRRLIPKACLCKGSDWSRGVRFIVDRSTERCIKKSIRVLNADNSQRRQFSTPSVAKFEHEQSNTVFEIEIKTFSFRKSDVYNNYKFKKEIRGIAFQDFLLKMECALCSQRIADGEYIDYLVLVWEVVWVDADADGRDWGRWIRRVARAELRCAHTICWQYACRAVIGGA